MVDRPERKSPTEPLDIQQRIEDTLSGKRPIDERRYPYFPPDYGIPFVHIGTERQLFLDNFILDHLEDVERVFPEPYRPEEPILEVGDLPWENPEYASPQPSGAVFDPDDRKFKLWYVQSLSGDPFNTGQVLCYAESTDCLHWEKPLSDRCLPYRGHTETNIVLRDAVADVVLNHDRSDPDKKFLILNIPYGQARARGQHINSMVAASPDGLRWTTISDDTPYRQHGVRPLWDEAIQKWIAYGQYSHHWNYLHRKRQIGRQESADFINWSPKEVVLSVDWDPNLPPHLEFHEMSVRKIGGLYIGITGEFIAEPLWQVREGHNWRDIAHVRLGLYASRDGKRWQRVGGSGPWADNRGPNSIDYGYVCSTANGQLLHDGRIHIPYLAGPGKQHWFGDRYKAPTPVLPEAAFERGKRAWQDLVEILGGYPLRPRSTSVLILREDGWAELKPTYERGKVITRQFVFEGDTLKVNAHAYGGYVRVDILDPHFKPYPDFSAGECDPVLSDDPKQVWHTVSWRGTTDVRPLWNKPVRLVFHLHQASLYAFQFEDSQQLQDG